MDNLNDLEITESQQKQCLMDCYRIALDFGLAAGNLAAEQVRHQGHDLLGEPNYSNT